MPALAPPLLGRYPALASTRGHGVGCTGDRVTGGHAALDRVEVERVHVVEVERVHVVDRFHAAAL